MSGPANPWGAADVAGAAAPVSGGPPQNVSVSGPVSVPATVTVPASSNTPIPLGVSSVRQITIQNNTPLPVYRSYVGNAWQGALVINPGTTLFDTVTSTQLWLFSTGAFSVNGGPGGVVVEVYP